jgi:hypothetical protein
MVNDNTNKKTTESTIDDDKKDNELPTKQELERDMKPSNTPHSSLPKLTAEDKEEDTTKPKQTIVKESLTRKEYAKVGIPLPYSIDKLRATGQGKSHLSLGSGI